MSLIAVAKRVPGTRLEFFAEISPTDWKPLVACGDAPRGGRVGTFIRFEEKAFCEALFSRLSFK